MTSNDSGITGISTIGIPVSDQDAALAFYRDVLGFAVRVDAPLPQLGSRWIMLGFPATPVTISLVAASEHTPVGGETGIRFETADAAATHEYLTSNGITVGELLRWPGVPVMFQARDVDGNRFEVVQAAGIED
ncbi:MAG TPA: VOC family protein [Galbitalea sp.]|jgi:catechol 2,3-dioxygenase-like lactoylglutathione lyase family enzyme